MKISSLGFVHEKNIQRGFNLLFDIHVNSECWSIISQNAPPLPFDLGEMKANCPLWNSVCTSDSKHGLEHLNLWLCARTLVFLLDRHVRHLELATRGRTSWSEFKFRPFLTIHFCFVFEKRPLERHNAFFFEWIDAVSKPGVLSHPTNTQDLQHHIKKHG